MADNAVKTGMVKQKVWGAAVGSSAGSFIAVIFVWLLKKEGVDIPDNVEAAITGLISLLFAGGGGYFTPPGQNETNIVEGSSIKSAMKTA